MRLTLEAAVSVDRARCLAVVAFCLLYASAAGSAQNDEPDHKDSGSAPPLSCIDIDAVPKGGMQRVMSMYGGLKRCLDAGDYARAARLYALASVDNDFAFSLNHDKSAAPALDSAMKAQIFESVSQDVQDAFAKTLKSEIAAGSATLTHLCSDLRRLGPPADAPSHVAGAEIDLTRVWTRALQGSLKCPA